MKRAHTHTFTYQHCHLETELLAHPNLRILGVGISRSAMIFLRSFSDGDLRCSGIGRASLYNRRIHGPTALHFRHAPQICRPQSRPPYAHTWCWINVSIFWRAKSLNSGWVLTICWQKRKRMNQLNVSPLSSIHTSSRVLPQFSIIQTSEPCVSCVSRQKVNGNKLYLPYVRAAFASCKTWVALPKNKTLFFSLYFLFIIAHT